MATANTVYEIIAAYRQATLHILNVSNKARQTFGFEINDREIIQKLGIRYLGKCS